MTEPRNGEWDRWRAAWRDGAPAEAGGVQLPELERRWRRHRRAAWTYTALDLIAMVMFWGIAVVVARRHPSLPMIVWAISVVVFSVVGAGGALWNRRDALFVATEPTGDFTARLRLRLDRRVRLLRFVAGFVVVEIGYGIVFFLIWSPGSLWTAVVVYSVVVPPLAAWGWWHRRRLQRERAQLDALDA